MEIFTFSGTGEEIKNSLLSLYSYWYLDNKLEKFKRKQMICNNDDNVTQMEGGKNTNHKYRYLKYNYKLHIKK